MAPLQQLQYSSVLMDSRGIDRARSDGDSQMSIEVEQLKTSNVNDGTNEDEEQMEYEQRDQNSQEEACKPGPDYSQILGSEAKKNLMEITRRAPVKTHKQALNTFY